MPKKKYYQVKDSKTGEIKVSGTVYDVADYFGISIYTVYRVESEKMLFRNSYIESVDYKNEKKENKNSDDITLFCTLGVECYQYSAIRKLTPCCNYCKFNKECIEKCTNSSDKCNCSCGKSMSILGESEDKNKTIKKISKNDPRFFHIVENDLNWIKKMIEGKTTKQTSIELNRNYSSLYERQRKVISHVFYKEKLPKNMSIDEWKKIYKYAKKELKK